MSKSRLIARTYALDNGEVDGTMDYETTVLDFENGFIAGSKNDKELLEQIAQLKCKLITAKSLLLQTLELPQNQTWNTLYPAGEKIRNNIRKFMQ